MKKLILLLQQKPSPGYGGDLDFEPLNVVVFEGDDATEQLSKRLEGAMWCLSYSFVLVIQDIDWLAAMSRRIGLCQNGVDNVHQVVFATDPSISSAIKSRVLELQEERRLANIEIVKEEQRRIDIETLKRLKAQYGEV